MELDSVLVIAESRDEFDAVSCAWALPATRRKVAPRKAVSRACDDLPNKDMSRPQSFEFDAAACIRARRPPFSTATMMSDDLTPSFGQVRLVLL
jgi:hypothetical protein